MLTCVEVFHPYWWNSWGFRDHDLDVKELAMTQLDLENVHKELW